MSLTFMIGAVVVTIIGNLVILRWLLTRPLDLVTFEETPANPPASPTAS